LLEARELYIASDFYPWVAVSSIVGNRLVKDVLRAYILIRKGGCLQPPPEIAFDQLERIDVNGIVRFLKEADVLSVEAAKGADSLGKLRTRTHTRATKTRSLTPSSPSSSSTRLSKELSPC